MVFKSKTNKGYVIHIGYYDKVILHNDNGRVRSKWIA